MCGGEQPVILAVGCLALLRHLGAILTQVSLSSQVWFENTTTNIAFDTTNTLRKILHIKTLQNNFNKLLQK